MRQGDTDATPYGWGTFASRSMVVGGGATRRASDLLADRLKRLAAHLLEADPEDLELRDGEAVVRGAPANERDVRRRSRGSPTSRPTSSRTDVEPGLECTASFDPPGTFSNACHGAIVELDPETMDVRIERYVVVEDCGVMVNPAIVEGQVRGGVAQGIAAALYEELAYGEDGQLQNASLMDYLVPTAWEIPAVEILHLETPSAVLGDRREGDGGGRHDGRARLHRHRGLRRARPPRRRGRPHPDHPRPPARGAARAGAGMSDPHLISITVNGVRHETVVEARRSLADVLRHDLGLTGTHIGCEHGICGTCTVLVEGKPARSCLMFGVQADDLQRRDRREPGRERRAQRAPAGLRRRPRPAVRLLHPRLPHARHRALARESRIPPTKRSAPRCPPTCAAAPATRGSWRPCAPPPTPEPRRSTMATTSSPPKLDPQDVLGLDHLLGDEELMLRDSVRRWVGDRVLPDDRRLVRGGRSSRASSPRSSATSACSGCTSRATAAPARQRDRLRRRVPGARGRRLRAPQPRLRAGLAGDVPDLEVRLRGAEAAVAAGHGGGRPDRLLRPDRAGLRLRARRACARPPSATATTGSSTARSMWITNGGIADVAIVWARHDDGIRGFVVPTDTKGFTARDIHRKLSLRASVTSELRPRRRAAARDAVLPEVTGMRGPLSCLNEARYGICWGAVGAARACYESALEYAKTRVQFGRPIAGFQLTQRKLVDMMLELRRRSCSRCTSGG